MTTAQLRAEISASTGNNTVQQRTVSAAVSAAEENVVLQ